MFCTKCGSEVKEGQLFCTKCGNKIESVQGNSVKAASKVVADKKIKQAEAGDKSGKNILLILIIVIVTVLVLGGITAGAYFFLVKDKTTSYIEDRYDDDDDRDSKRKDSDEDRASKRRDADDKDDENKRDDQDGDGSEGKDILEGILGGVDQKETLEDYENGIKTIAGTILQKYVTIQDYWPTYDFDIMAEGTIDYIKSDFDGDGANEILQVEAKNDGSIELLMKEYSESLGVVDGATLNADYYDISDDGQVDIFTYSINNEKYICVYDWSSVYMACDGISIGVKVYKYADEKFNEVKLFGYSGSDGMEPDDFDKDCREVGIHGIDWYSLFDGSKTLYDYAGSDKSMIARAYQEGRYITHDSTLSRTEFGKLYLGGFSDDTKAEFSNKNSIQGWYTSNYIIPDSNSRYLSYDDLMGLTEWECRVARNEILARHGRKFKDKELQEYFYSKEWYSGYIEPDKFNESILNDYERENMYLIKSFENENY